MFHTLMGFSFFSFFLMDIDFFFVAVAFVSF